MASVKQTTYSLDMAMSTASELVNVFPFNVEKGISAATAITIENINFAGTRYRAVPAWYDVTNKRLYSSVTSSHYWAVSGNTVAYT